MFLNAHEVASYLASKRTNDFLWGWKERDVIWYVCACRICPL